eukprot:4624949-Alexandrium_andersonii.AAC.1
MNREGDQRSAARPTSAIRLGHRPAIHRQARRDPARSGGSPSRPNRGADPHHQRCHKSSACPPQPAQKCPTAAPKPSEL